MRGAVIAKSSFHRTKRHGIAILPAVLFFLLVQPPRLTAAQTPGVPLHNGPGAQSQEMPSVRFKVDVNLTILYATVKRPDGWVDRTLTAKDFDLREDDQEQKIAFFNRESELPLRIALLVDSSLSTARDLKFEEQAATRFFQSVLRPQDSAAIFDFSYDVDQLSGYTNNVRALSRGIRSIIPGTATSLYDAIYLASSTLKRQKQKKVMVIVSDGADTTSHVSYDEALKAADEAQAIIYAIIITPIKSDAGRALGGEHALMTLSEETGGKAFIPNSIGELDSIYAKISDELRTQYAIGYYSNVRSPSTELRRIKLTTRNPQLVVRTRHGYYAPNR